MSKLEEWMKKNRVSYRQAQELAKVDFTTIYKVVNPKLNYQPTFNTLKRLERMTDGEVTLLEMLQDIKEVQDAI